MQLIAPAVEKRARKGRLLLESRVIRSLSTLSDLTSQQCSAEIDSLTRKEVFMKRMLGFFIVCFLCVSVSALAAPCGKITRLEGQVDVLRPGEKAAARVSLGDPVEVGEIYSAKTRSKAEITFNNRNVLRIAATTRVEIKEFMLGPDKSSAVVKLHGGRVQAMTSEDLAMRMVSFAEGKFEVHTENAVAGIRDTNMLVGFERGVTTVLLISGNIYLFNPLRPENIMSLGAGQISTIPTSNALPTQPRPASDAERRSLVVQVTPSPRIAADVKGGVPVPQIITNAHNAGMNMETIVSEALHAGADPVAVVTSAVTTDPSSAFVIVDTAVNVYPSQAPEIVNAVLTVPGVNSGSVITAAAVNTTGNPDTLANLRTVSLNAGVPQATVDAAMTAAAGSAAGAAGNVGGGTGTIGGTGGTGGYGYGASGSGSYSGSGGGGTPLSGSQ